MKIRRPNSVLLALVLLVTLLSGVVGCASTGRVQQQVEAQMQLGNYPGALEVVEAEREGALGGKNRLLYFLERGMLLHLDGQYVESNAAFDEAEPTAADLYTKSLTGEGISLMTNDYALDYAGENFERTLIHLFAAMNYSQLGEQDAALVEARQVGEYLRKLQIDTEDENAYQEDAFARYLTAMLYESAGEHDSSLVSYKKAIEGYGVPGWRLRWPVSLSYPPTFLCTWVWGYGCWLCSSMCSCFLLP